MHCKTKNKNYPLPTAHYSLSDSDGFTLIELVISMAVVAVLSGAVLQVARFSDTHKSLTLATDEFRAALREAQSSSLSIPNPQDEHVCGFGVRIGSAGADFEVFYTAVTPAVFQADPNACKATAYLDGNNGATAVRKVTLPPGIAFSADHGSTIMFGVPYGEAYDNVGTKLTGVGETYTLDNGGTTKTITVNPSGMIE